MRIFPYKRVSSWQRPLSAPVSPLVSPLQPRGGHALLRSGAPERQALTRQRPEAKEEVPRAGPVTCHVHERVCVCVCVCVCCSSLRRSCIWASSCLFSCSLASLSLPRVFSCVFFHLAVTSRNRRALSSKAYAFRFSSLPAPRSNAQVAIQRLLSEKTPSAFKRTRLRRSILTLLSAVRDAL